MFFTAVVIPVRVCARGKVKADFKNKPNKTTKKDLHPLEKEIVWC